MTLSAATLASQMDIQITNQITEPPARAAWALAWTTYFYDATSNGIPIPSDALNAAKAGLESGLTGFSASGQGALKIQMGLTVFWSVLSASPPAIFPGAIAITPPSGLATIPAALAAVFVINASPGITKAQALQNIANALHSAAGLGGTGTFPPSVIFPIL